MSRIKIRRGNLANLPILYDGEPAYTKDTNELFIGSAKGNKKLFNLAESSINGNLLVNDVEIQVYDDTSVVKTVNNISPTNGNIIIPVGLIGTKSVDETNLADTKILQYDATSGKYILVDKPTGNGNMLQSTYDVNSSGIVDDSEKLGGQLPYYYASSSDLGDPSNLTTADKTNLVNAINENTSSLADIATNPNTANSLQDALNSIHSGKLLLPNKDFSLADILNIPCDNLEIEGVKGSRLILDTNKPLLSGAGSTSNLQSITAFTNDYITVADASGFAIGDDVYLSSNKLETYKGYQTYGEFAEITDIQGSNIYFANGLGRVYQLSESPTIQKVSFKTLKIKGVTFKGNNSPTVNTDTAFHINLQLQFFKDVIIEDCTFDTAYHSSIFLIGCQNVKIKNNRFKNVYKGTWTSGPSCAIVTAFCQDVHVEKNSFYNCPQAVTFSYATHDSVMKGNRAYQMTIGAFSTHARGEERIQFVRNIVIGVGSYGISCDAKHSSVKGNIIISRYQKSGGVGIQLTKGVGGLALDNYFCDCSQNQIIGNLDYGIYLLGMTDLDVSHNMIKLDSCAIAIRGINIAKSKIASNKIKYGNPSATSYGIYIYYQAGSTLGDSINIDNIDIDLNQIESNSINSSGMPIRISPLSTYYPNHIKANSNDILCSAFDQYAIYTTYTQGRLVANGNTINGSALLWGIYATGSVYVVGSFSNNVIGTANKVKNPIELLTTVGSAPMYIGQMAIVGTVVYIATGISASTDWKQVS